MDFTLIFDSGKTKFDFNDLLTKYKKIMERFFIEGGIIFMSILTLLFLIILSLSVLSFVKALKSKNHASKGLNGFRKQIKSIALFALIFGILGQVLGLVQIFDYLSDSSIGVAASVLAKGIKTTFNPTLYGIGIYLVSILLSMGLDFKINTEIK